MRARPAGPAQSSALHNSARRASAKEAHLWAPNRSGGLLRGEAGGRAYGAMINQRNDHLLPLPTQQRKICPSTCGFGARGGIRTLDLPITSRKAFVHQVLARPVLAAQVSGVVCCVRS